MATPISKRQQARNERQLQDLIHTVPGNDRCADCAVKNPGWASWSLGIFLCVRCASLHRKLGTHVSKVKSLSMDAWSTEQVDNMKKMGNVRSNSMYNPQNVKADVPIDADEVDGAVERFIRQKYESKSLSMSKLAPRQNTGSTSTGSWNDEPPPLPPKPKKFPFNFRSASSTTQRPRQGRLTPPLSPVSAEGERNGTEAGKLPLSKPSQVFGMKITSVGNNFDQKLVMLRDMGFSDNRKNSEILKGSNGNLDKAVETLVRLGEGGNLPSSTSTPATSTLTPTSMASPGPSGISVDKTRQSKSKISNDPWEVREASPQRSVSQPAPTASPLPRSQSAGPPSNSWNPFFNQQQQDASIQQLGTNFQSLQVSHTGPAPQQQQQQQYLAPQIPSVPQIPSQYQAQAFQPQQLQTNAWQFQQAQPFQQPQGNAPQVSQPQALNHFNPFMTSQPNTSINPWSTQPSMTPAVVTQQSSPWTIQTQSPAPMAQQSSNPFMSNAPAGSWPQQQQQQGNNVFQPPAINPPAPMAGQQNYVMQQHQPYQDLNQPQQSTQNPSPNPWQQQYQQPGQAVQAPPSQPMHYDKNSILALYNMPHLAPRQPLQSLQEDLTAVPQQAPVQRSVTMPIQAVASTNPFTASTQPIRHVSNESVDFVNLRGRHSPDAFAGLSAQYMR